MSDLTQRELAGLALTAVPSLNAALRLRAARWFNLVHMLGIHVPAFVAHDMGLLWSMRRTTSSATIAPHQEALEKCGASKTLIALTERYSSLMARIAQSDVVQRCQRWGLQDDVIAVLITKVFTPIYRAWPVDGKRELTRIELPLESGRYATLGAPLRPTDQAHFESFLTILLAKELQIRHAIEQLDIDTLRLLGLFQGEAGPQSPLQMVDLLGLFTTPMVNDIVNFSLQIIPSVLETTKQRDAQISSMDGFEGVERTGHMDNLMLSEMAYDDDIFYQKFLDNELFYFSRSRAREEERKLHYVLVDSSASMRGRRGVFARGIALAMLKKLLVQGEKPILRFFDSQLYELIEVRSGFSVPYLLSFRSERGRNYSRVFEHVLTDVRRLREERQQDVMLYILTHGQCHLPPELVLRLREVAYLFGIFILPGERLDITYADLLHRVRTVDESALQSTSNRKQAAFDILSSLD